MVEWRVRECLSGGGGCGEWSGDGDGVCVFERGGCVEGMVEGVGGRNGGGSWMVEGLG